MAPVPFTGSVFTSLSRHHFGRKDEQEEEEIGHEELIFEKMKDGDSLKLYGYSNIEQPKLMTVGKNGEFLEVPHSLSTLPPGFVLGGDIKLFGMELPAKLYTFVGELAKAGSIKEMVTIGEKVFLKDLLKGLTGSVFGDVPLVNPEFIYNDADPETGKAAGMHFKADILFEGALAGVHETLKNVFGLQTHSSLSVGGFVAATREWTKPLAPPEMALSGVFLGIEAKLGGLLTFTSVGVELTALKKEEKVNDHSNYHCKYGFFGIVDLEIPGSVVPLAMSYSLKEEVSGTYVLRLKKEGSDWINVGGFKGLNLSSVQLISRFPVKNVLKEISFETEAVLQFPGVDLNLRGVYSPGGFYLEAEVPKISIADIRQFYSDLTGRELENFKHDVQLKDLVLRIDPTALSFSGEVTIDGHHSVKATVKIHRDGISITGTVADINLGSEITIEKAELDVFIGRSDPNTTSRESGFEINGKVHFKDMDIMVGLYTVLEENQPVMWTVYGELDADIRLSRLAPEVEGSFLDIALRRVALIVSNQDSPSGDFNLSNYPIRRGVQFCAVIDRIEQLDHVSGGRVEGLILRASYSSNAGFSFGVAMPAPVTFSLGPSVTSGPISLEIVASKLPQLMFTAPLSVKLAGQTQPLVFTFGLKADAISASGFGQMTNYWINPFGIFNEKVKIGPDVALEIGIIYAALAATGAPSKILFSGGLAIGNTEAQVAMAISQNPAEQLLKASLSELSITDLVTFASKVSRQDIPLPPKDLLAFRDVSFYISTGMSIGTTHYPTGASIKGEMKLFGKETSVECTIGSTTKISALFDEVQLGPLMLAGVGESRPSMAIELGLMKQHILVDGRLKFFELDASVRSVFDILPKPDMRFDISFAFAEVLEIEASARVVGAADIKNLRNADFLLDVILEQDILQYINTHIKVHFGAIKKALKEGADAARKFFEEEKKRLDVQLMKAKKVLEAAEVAWEAKEKEIKDALEEVFAELEEGRLELQRDLEEAQREFETALYQAHQNLEQARIDRAAFIFSAAIDIMHIRNDFKIAIKNQLFDVRATKEETKSKFGVLLEDVKDAEEEARKAQESFGEAEKELEEAVKELEEAPFYSKIRLSLEVGHRKAHFSDAQDTLLYANRKLAMAQEALEGSGYQSAVAVKTAKVIELESTKQDAEATIKKVERKLEVETKVFNKEVEASKKAISEQTAVIEQKEALKKAEKTLKKFEITTQARIETLRNKKEALPESAEHKKLELASEKLSIVKGATKEVEVASQAVKLIEKEIHGNPRTIGKDIVGKLEKMFDIQRIELHGSLKDLVEKGQPLKARVQGVIAGREIDFVIGYGIGKTVDFMKALLRKLWEEVKESISNSLDSFSDGFGDGKIIVG